ncbi:MAG TPA: alpha/beta family hydrolase [Vicinamibacteria bacterium]|nr:alpha/beta family hydrolase [Vicinamibacteria bacterium]
MQALEIPGAEASASLHGRGRTVVVLGHGAGGNRRHPMLVALADAVAASGRAALLYDFPYAAKGRRRPDPPAVLEATTRAAAALALEETGALRIVHGGRSMGGRIASQVVAAGGRADGLAFLGYPLHPPGQPERRREAHLPRIEAPMLFVQGTRDDFAREDLLLALVERLGPRAELAHIREADHSFGVRKSSGRAPEDVLADVRDALLAWLDRHGLY